jgi:endonuclease-3
MILEERYRKTIDYFLKEDPDPETELEYEDPFELIVAVILSAQCTDKRVNLITPALLKVYPDAVSMASAEPDEILKYIKSCSYPNSKSKYLVGMARMLVERYRGIVPDDPDLLQELPGVGRKTANVIASVVFKKPVMAVDTHVFRVSRRIGLAVNAKTPREVEDRLSQNIPEELIHKAHHWLILHGRYICKARSPLCEKCGLSEFCRYFIKESGKKGVKNISDISKSIQ